MVAKSLSAPDLPIAEIDSAPVDPGDPTGWELTAKRGRVLVFWDLYRTYMGSRLPNGRSCFRSGVLARIKFGDRISDDPRAIRSDPFHGEQFVPSARAC